MHLQQTYGNASAHLPFIRETFDKGGIINAAVVLGGLAEAYSKPVAGGLPPQCEKITLTLEPFMGTADNPYLRMEELRESAGYWRRYIPEDGIRLSEALEIVKRG